MVPDVVNALAGWLTQRYGEAVVAGVGHMFLGNPQQRAFREVVSGAIGRAVERVGGNQQVFLGAVLAEHHERLEAVRRLPDLAAAVHALIDSLDEPSDPHVVAPRGLADALIAEINIGILENARAGGPLAPLVAEANFAELFALSNELRMGLDTILARMEAMEDALRERAPITVNMFTGGWRPLLHSYLDPTEARARLLSEPFTGREWLVQEIDAFVATRDRGYFIVQADAGAGKTAFALWYSGLDSRPIHFTQYGADARSTASAVCNLAAQLIALWGLHDLAPGGHLPAEADWSSWLRQVLTAAARRRDTEAPGRPIVLVVDGLDEAVDGDCDHLPFGLPDDLPGGVYVVATVRTGGLPHQPRQPKVVCDWNRRQAQQQGDMQAFLAEWVQRHMMGALESEGLHPTSFVSALLDQCGEVWLYLHYVLAELAAGARRPRDVPLLPRGLDDYYHNTIEGFCRDDAEAAWRLPLVATLAVAVEPLDASTLINLAGLQDHPPVRRFLYGPLRPFCTVSAPDRLSFKHPSFSEYLTAGPSPDDDTADNVQQWRRRLANECRAAHERICDRYLTVWGGLDAQLPALAADPALAQRDGGYPLRALATHLVAAGRDGELHQLLACGPQYQNVWYTAHESAGETAGFLHDLDMARQALDSPSGALKSPVIALKARYALMEAAVVTVSANITPDLLEVLVNRRRWSITRAFGIVERITDADQRAEALHRIIDVLPDALVPNAWTLALSFPEPQHRCRAVTALIPRLPDDLLDSAIHAVAEHIHQSWVMAPAVALVQRLPQGRLNRFLRYGIPAGAHAQRTLIQSMVSLSEGNPGAADRALAGLVAEVDNWFDRCQYLAALIPLLPPSAFDQVIDVLSGCRARYRSDSLIALARHAPADRLTDLLVFATDVEWETTPPEAEQQPWLHLMRELGPRLTSPEHEAGAVAIALAMRPEFCAEAIEVLAPHLTAESARQVLSDVTKHSDYESVTIILAAVAAHLPPAEARTVVNRYVDVELRLTDEPEIDLAKRLAPVVTFLHPDTVRMTLRSICRALDLNLNLRSSLERMAPQVGTDPGLTREALAVMLEQDVWNPGSRLVVLSVLAPYLDDEALDEAMNMMLPGPVEVECFTAVADLCHALPSNNERAEIARRALDLALSIDNDRRRMKALTALAPALPRDLAVEALEFVGSMTRRAQSCMFEALDALAPRLPAAALPRALAILMDTPGVDGEEIQHVTRLIERLGRDDPTGAIRHYLHDPRGPQSHPARSWLWAIAPFLSASLAEEALAPARAQPDRARLISLAALAPRLPHMLRDGVAREVLDLLDPCPDDMGIRMAVLARLAAATAMDEVITACQSSVEGLYAQSLLGADYSQEAANDLLRHLPDAVIESAVRVSARETYLLDRCLILTPLIPRLPEHLVPKLIAELQAVENPYHLGERARALVALAARTSANDERQRILTVLLERMIERWWYENDLAFIGMIPLLLPQQRSRAVAAALRQCFRSFPPEDPRPLIEILDGTELRTALSELNNIPDPHKKARTTAAVLRQAGVLAERSTALRDIDVLATWPPSLTRAEMFTLIGASAWWIRHQGGNRAVSATIDAVFDVSRWWR